MSRNLELLVSLPGGDSVRGFFMVTLLVELAAVPALRVNLGILKSMLKSILICPSQTSGTWKTNFKSVS
jgi:hypothetical protein